MGSASYQFRVPPDPDAVRVGKASFWQIGGGLFALGALGFGFTVSVIVAGVAWQVI